MQDPLGKDDISPKLAIIGGTKKPYCYFSTTKYKTMSRLVEPKPNNLAPQLLLCTVAHM